MPPGPEPAAAPLPFARPLLTLADSDIDAHILRDVMPSATSEPSRWTNSRPAFRLVLTDARDLQLYLHFFLPELTLSATGPVTLSISIDGTRVAAPRFTQPGDHEFQCPVPAGLLKPHRPLTLAFDVWPVYRAQPQDPPLGVVLFAAGFRRPQ